MGIMKKYRLKTETEKVAVLGMGAFWEIKALPVPPSGTEVVFYATMIMLGEDRDLTWPAVQNMLSTPRRFMDSLVNFDPSKLTHDKLEKLKEYTSQETFTIENFSKSKVAARLCAWVLAVADLLDDMHAETRKLARTTSSMRRRT